MPIISKPPPQGVDSLKEREKLGRFPVRPAKGFAQVQRFRRGGIRLARWSHRIFPTVFHARARTPQCGRLALYDVIAGSLPLTLIGSQQCVVGSALGTVVGSQVPLPVVGSQRSTRMFCSL